MLGGKGQFPPVTDRPLLKVYKFFFGKTTLNLSCFSEQLKGLMLHS